MSKKATLGRVAEEGGCEGRTEVEGGSRHTCFSPEAERTEGALSMPDVKVGNQLATTVIHVFPTLEEDRAESLRGQGLLQVSKELGGRHQDDSRRKGLKPMEILELE